MVYVSGGNELLDPMEILGRLGVTTGSIVADLGCGGAGHFTIPAAKLVGHKTIVYAVDIQKTVLASVASISRLEGISNIKTVWSDLETLGSTNISQGSLDHAMIINMLFQSKKHKEVLQEAMRLIRSNGKIMVVDWKHGHPNLGPQEQDRVDPKKIKTVAKDLQLKLVDEFEAGTYHFGLIFTK